MEHPVRFDPVYLDRIVWCVYTPTGPGQAPVRIRIGGSSRSGHGVNESVETTSLVADGRSAEDSRGSGYDVYSSTRLTAEVWERTTNVIVWLWLSEFD